MKLATLALAIFIGSCAGPSAMAASKNAVIEVAPGATEKNIHVGNIEISGTAGYIKQGDISTLTLAPEVGYFIVDKLVIGLGLSYTSLSTSTASVSTTSFAPRVSYYFVERGPWAALATQKIILSSGSSSVGAASGSTTAGQTSVGARYFLNRYIALGGDLALSYGLSSNYTSSFGLIGGISVNI
jgi:hypothetical protein